jgi:molybdopterin synthase sulfur carrier subunit
MQVNFYATFRQVVGKKTVEISLREGSSLRQLIEGAVRDYPDLRHELLDEKGEILGHVHVFINGRDLAFLENGLDTSLQADDTVSVFPPVGGG